MTSIDKIKPSKIPEILRGIINFWFDRHLEATVVAFLVLVLAVAMGVHNRNTCVKKADTAPQYACELAGEKYLSDPKSKCYLHVQKT